MYNYNFIKILNKFVFCKTKNALILLIDKELIQDNVSLKKKI